MAQTGGVLARLTAGMSSNEGENGAAIYFMAIDRVKFRRPVVPGDQLRMEVQPLRKGSRVWKMAGKAYVGNELAAEAELMASLG